LGTHPFPAGTHAHSSTSFISKGRHGMELQVKERKGMSWNGMEMECKERHEKSRCVPMVLLKIKNSRDGTQSMGKKMFLKSKLN
jgi:hypothetical protein